MRWNEDRLRERRYTYVGQGPLLYFDITDAVAKRVARRGSSCRSIHCVIVAFSYKCPCVTVPLLHLHQ